MKRILLTIFLLPCYLFSQENPINNIEQLKSKHLYQEMDSLNEVSKGPDYFFYKAIYFNVTNNPKASLKALTHKQNNHLQHSLAYIKLINDNATKSFNYPLAFQSSKQITQQFHGQLSKEELEEETNNQRIWEVLAKIPKQKISTFRESSIPTKKDLAGLVTINVSSNGQAKDFVFDTGAGLSCITATQATKMGLKILPDNQVEVKSFTGQVNKVQVAVAPELMIGTIRIKNAIFLVYPDAAFSFAAGQYQIDGIIGFPIAKELGTVIMEENKLTFSQKKSAFLPQKNFYVDLLRPILVVEYNGKKLSCNFDSGASHTLFTRSFYQAFQTYIDVNGEENSLNAAGAGAEITQTKIKTLTHQLLKIGNKSIPISKINIAYEDYGVYGKENFGNIGQDILKQYKKVIMSFNENYFSLEN